VAEEKPLPTYPNVRWDDWSQQFVAVAAQGLQHVSNITLFQGNWERNGSRLRPSAGGVQKGHARP
jgi:hypothetical protein